MVERKTKPCKNTLVQKPHVISIKHNPFWISNHIIGKKKKKDLTMYIAHLYYHKAVRDCRLY